jgi:hypothetical protein
MKITGAYMRAQRRRVDGAMGNAGWGVLIVERSADGAVFDLSYQGVEVAPVLSGYYWANEQRL